MKYKKIGLIIFLIFNLQNSVFANLVYADDKENSLLKIQAKLFPRIILFDKNFKDRLSDGFINFIIIAKKDDKSAKNFKKMIEKNYHDSINKIPIKIIINDGVNLFKNYMPTAVYFFDTKLINDEFFKNICKYKIPSFGYSVKSFKLKALVTIELLNKVKPLINKEVLKHCAIPFSASFLKLARIYDETDYKK